MSIVARIAIVLDAHVTVQADHLGGSRATRHEFYLVMKNLLSSRYPGARIADRDGSFIHIADPKRSINTDKLGRSMAHVFGGNFSITSSEPSGAF